MRSIRTWISIFRQHFFSRRGHLHGSASTFQAATMYGEPSVSLIR
jgi:hypothetical protein